MANTFKTKTNDADASECWNTTYTYTVASSTTTVVIGLTLCNIHTTSVTADVQLVSDTNQIQKQCNKTVLLAKDGIPAGSH